MKKNIGRQYENKKAGELGTKVPGSGNKWYNPGDMTSKYFLQELKATGSKSFSITLKALNKIKGEAFKAKKQSWAFLVEVSGEEFVVISKDEFLKLKETEEMVLNSQTINDEYDETSNGGCI